MTPDSLPLDLWLLRQATMVALLAERRMLRPWRAQMLATARELQRRAVEARRLRDALDRIVAAAEDEARCEHGLVVAELNDVVTRWKRGKTP